jgi:hypothetical protein
MEAAFKMADQAQLQPEGSARTRSKFSQLVLVD